MVGPKFTSSVDVNCGLAILVFWFPAIVFIANIKEERHSVYGVWEQVPDVFDLFQGPFQNNCPA